jgi:putative intracellular protease/amidase
VRPERRRRAAGHAPIWLLTAAVLAACGARPPAPALETSPAPAPPVGSAVEAPGDLAPTGLPGMGPYKLLVLAGPGVSGLEVIGMAYAANALGWQVTVTAPATAALRGAHGEGLPLDKALGEVDASGYDALFVPAGAPADPAALALVSRFTGEAADGPLFVATNAGLNAVRGAAGLAAWPPTTRDRGVHLENGRLVGARAGDIPALAHALDAVMRDRRPGKKRP